MITFLVEDLLTPKAFSPCDMCVTDNRKDSYFVSNLDPTITAKNVLEIAFRQHFAQIQEERMITQQKNDDIRDKLRAKAISRKLRTGNKQVASKATY